MFLCDHSFFSGNKCLGVQLLDYVSCTFLFYLFIYFYCPTIFQSRHSIYIYLQKCKSYHVSHYLPSSWHCHFLKPFCWYIVLSHCGFSLHFMSNNIGIFSCVFFLPSIYYSIKSLYIFSNFLFF